jgi:hypothetical protein
MVHVDDQPPNRLPASWRAHIDRIETRASWEPWGADVLRLAMREPLTDWIRDESTDADFIANMIFLTDQALSQ